MVNRIIEKSNLDEIVAVIKKSIGGDYSARVKLSGQDSGLDIVAAGVNKLINHVKVNAEGLDREICELRTSNNHLKQEILKLKKIQETLKESEEKYSEAFKASANAICIIRLADNIFIEANDSFTRFTGYSHNEVVGHSAVELELWVYKDELDDWSKTLKEQGRVYNKEFHSRMKSGEIRVGFGSAEIVNIGGEPCSIVVITDITEKKQIVEALELERQNFRNSIDNSFMGILVLDADSQALYSNKALIDIFGYDSTEEFITIPAEKRYTPEGLKKFNERRELRQAGKELPSRYEVDIVRKDGEIRNIVVFHRDIIWNGKKQFQTIWHDVTEHKKAEADREALLEDLQKLNARLEESNKELQDFVYVASHDLREPLRKIASFG
jgi:PAS domain S-box-containing protein